MLLLGEGLAVVGRTALAVGGAELMNAALAALSCMEVGLVADGVDPAGQETGPAGLLRSFARSGVGGIDCQRAKTQPGESTYR
ncbi:MAG: hypothetical protein RIQ83_1772 [Pseudomonadota bacterium]